MGEAKFSDAGHLARMIVTFQSGEEADAGLEVLKKQLNVLYNAGTLPSLINKVRDTELLLSEADKSSLTHAGLVATELATGNPMKLHFGRTLNTVIVSMRTDRPIHNTVFKESLPPPHLEPHSTLPPPFKH